MILTSRTATSKEPNHSSFSTRWLEFPDKTAPLTAWKISEKLKTVLTIGDCAALLKNALHNRRVKRSNRAQTAHQETRAGFRSQRCRGKGHRHHPSCHLTPQCSGTFLHLGQTQGKGRRKMVSVSKTELTSSRFVRALSPIGHHTLSTWKNCTEINASNFWPWADVAFCSFSDVMWISKERCWTEVPRTLQHEA